MDLSDLIDAVKNSSSTDEFCMLDKHAQDFAKALDFSCVNTPQVEELLLVVLQNGAGKHMEMFAQPIVKRHGLIDWKSRPDLVDRIVQSIKACVIYPKTLHGQRKSYSDFVAAFTQSLLACHAFEMHCDKLFQLVHLSLTTHDANSPIHAAMKGCVEEFSWKSRLELTAIATVALVDFVKANPNLTGGIAVHNCRDFMLATYRRFEDAQLMGKDGALLKSVDCLETMADLYVYVLPHMADLFNFCCTQEWTHEGKQTLSRKMLEYILDYYLKNGKIDQSQLIPMKKVIVNLWCSTDDVLQQKAEMTIWCMVNDCTWLVADQLEKLLSLILLGNRDLYCHALVQIYRHVPHAVETRLDEIVKFMRNATRRAIHVAKLFLEVAEKAITAITHEHVNALVSLYENEECASYVTAFLEALAAKQPDEVVKHEAAILRAFDCAAVYRLTPNNLLLLLASDHSKAETYLRLLASKFKPNTALCNRQYLLQTMNAIATLYPMHSSIVESVRCRERVTNFWSEPASLEDHREVDKVCMAKSSAVCLENEAKTLSNDLEPAERIATRICEPKGVNKQLKPLIKIAKSTVTARDKCLGHTPVWSSTLANTLGSKSRNKKNQTLRQHDWKSVAARLGYSNEDIRVWAAQPDPCLSMLDDWFANHKTPLATRTLYDVLQQLNRHDAAQVVLMNAAPDLLRQTSQTEYDYSDEAMVKLTPSIYLSYEMSNLHHVNQLKMHLTLAGYTACLAEHDAFIKNDAALRAAKVVVCCVTDKYAQSTNCNREVTLAVTLGKPIIPLLLEDIKWPPSGVLGPIFSEYLHIRFYNPSSPYGKAHKTLTSSGNTKCWTDCSFSELLMHLRYTHAPNMELITPDSPYKNWWQPLSAARPQSANKPTNSDDSQAPSTSLDSVKTTCDVFISYQWDMQPHVKLLYRRLTQLGYTCWLDIMQMGGGDSLYDKIDRGIRSCRVVLSCVTTKYALSANCRREVSLADALKKPIIPLLLEALQWPPEGPMGPALMKLCYIDFTYDIHLSTHIQCAQFDELVSQLESFHKSYSQNSFSFKSSCFSLNVTGNDSSTSFQAKRQQSGKANFPRIVSGQEQLTLSKQALAKYSSAGSYANVTGLTFPHLP